MSEPSDAKVLESRRDALVTVVVTAISVLVMVVLASTNMKLRQKVLEARILATLVPASGAMAGKNARDESEWEIPQGNELISVVFGVAEHGRTGDLEYWNDVLLRSRHIAPNVQFIGLCMANAICTAPPGSEALLTLLKSMDPLQTHALTVAARENRAFIFRGLRPEGALLIRPDRQEFTTQLAAIVDRKTRGDGV
jgi:hypothetical protein